MIFEIYDKETNTEYRYDVIGNRYWKDYCVDVDISDVPQGVKDFVAARLKDLDRYAMVMIIDRLDAINAAVGGLRGSFYHKFERI